jgi:hypothetical protein
MLNKKGKTTAKTPAADHDSIKPHKKRVSVSANESGMASELKNWEHGNEQPVR